MFRQFSQDFSNEVGIGEWTEIVSARKVLGLDRHLVNFVEKNKKPTLWTRS